MTLVLYVIGLVVVWVLAWGSLSVGNVLGGLAVAALLLWIAPEDWTGRQGVRIRPIKVAKLLIFIVSKVVTSNAVLVAAVLARGTRLHTGVMAIPLPDCSEGVLTVITNVIALTPGTSPIHLTRFPTVIYIHVLDMRDAEATRRDVQRLADLAYAAFGPQVTPASSIDSGSGSAT
jgi:multicomponent Na+:H+ antiporter subunit E